MIPPTHPGFPSCRHCGATVLAPGLCPVCSCPDPVEQGRLVLERIELRDLIEPEDLNDDGPFTEWN